MKDNSENENFETPPDLFATLNLIFEFKVDLAASKDNALCRYYFGTEKDSVYWLGDFLHSYSSYIKKRRELESSAKKTRIPDAYWVNPPYGRGSGKASDFLKTLINETQSNTVDLRTVALAPIKIEVKWFQSLLKLPTNPNCPLRIYAFDRRLKHWLDGKPYLDKNGKPAAGKFGSALIIFGFPEIDSEMILKNLESIGYGGAWLVQK